MERCQAWWQPHGREGMREGERWKQFLQPHSDGVPPCPALPTTGMSAPKRGTVGTVRQQP